MTYEQADFLLGQLAHVHWPGAQEQTSPQEQAVLPFSDVLVILGQLSQQVHWPGVHEQTSPQLPDQLYST